jgi:hypothetical protein
MCPGKIFTKKYLVITIIVITAFYQSLKIPLALTRQLPGESRLEAKGCPLSKKI